MPNACAEPVEELLHVLSSIPYHFSCDFVIPGTFVNLEFFDGFFDFLNDWWWFRCTIVPMSVMGSQGFILVFSSEKAPIYIRGAQLNEQSELNTLE